MCFCSGGLSLVPCLGQRDWCVINGFETWEGNEKVWFGLASGICRGIK
ncbi:hypothetical protein V6Z11_D11G157800 [Gossypium hirsutum]